MNNIPKIVLALYISVLILLPFSRLSELPVLILAIIGGIAFINKRQEILSSPGFKILTTVFLCYFLMIVFSATDSYWRDKTIVVALASWRFYFASIAMLFYLDSKQRKSLIFLLSIITAVWAIDALFQYFFGIDFIGRRSYPGRLNGIFGENHVKLGPVLALLFPVLLIGMLKINPLLRWVIAIAVIAVIILSGTRSAWIMMLFVLLAYWIHHVRNRRFILLVKTALISSVFFMALWFTSPEFQQRIKRSLTVFDGTESGLDYALANRIPIWKTSWQMIVNHPLNGVGAHAFRKAYPLYASEKDVWQQQGGVGMHAHHWVLEILTDTGIIGLLLIIFAIIQLFRFNAKHHSDFSWPFMVAIISAFLPIVSTYSVFSSFWSLCLWFFGSGLIFMSNKND